MTTTDPTAELKKKAKAIWSTGSYGEIATFVAPAAAHLVRATGVKRGDRVLDVATGTGVTAITAARAGARVVGLDLTPELLQRAKEEAGVAGVDDVEWREGDAEALPFEDGSFDVVISSFGHMFAPRPDVAGAELVRVAKSGARIGIVTHATDGVAAAFFRATAQHVPPPPNAPPTPMQWGDEKLIRERLGPDATEIRHERGSFQFPVFSPGHFWRLFSHVYGPTMKSVEALGGDRAKLEAFRKDWIAAITPFFENNAVRMDYVLTTAKKR